MHHFNKFKFVSQTVSKFLAWSGQQNHKLSAFKKLFPDKEQIGQNQVINAHKKIKQSN